MFKDTILYRVTKSVVRTYLKMIKSLSSIPKKVIILAPPVKQKLLQKRVVAVPISLHRLLDQNRTRKFIKSWLKIWQEDLTS